MRGNLADVHLECPEEGDLLLISCCLLVPRLMLRKGAGYFISGWFCEKKLILNSNYGPIGSKYIFSPNSLIPRRKDCNHIFQIIFSHYVFYEAYFYSSIFPNLNDHLSRIKRRRDCFRGEIILYKKLQKKNGGRISSHRGKISFQNT